MFTKLTKVESESIILKKEALKKVHGAEVWIEALAIMESVQGLTCGGFCATYCGAKKGSSSSMYNGNYTYR